MSFKELYQDLKKGITFTDDWHYIYIDTCDRWNSPSYGKDYIYYQYFGSSATSVSFENLKWIIQEIFECPTANDFVKRYKPNY